MRSRVLPIIALLVGSFGSLGSLTSCGGTREPGATARTSPWLTSVAPTLPPPPTAAPPTPPTVGVDERALISGVPRVVSQGEHRRIAIGALPISTLAPGEYVVRAIISLDGRPIGRITRTLRKSASGS